MVELGITWEEVEWQSGPCPWVGDNFCNIPPSHQVVALSFPALLHPPSGLSVIHPQQQSHYKAVTNIPFGCWENPFNFRKPKQEERQDSKSHFHFSNFSATKTEGKT